MKNAFFKVTALLLAVQMLTAVFIHTPVDAKNSDEDRALTMMYLAHGRINGISDINQLKNMKDDYFDHYDEMLNNPNLDEEQKARLLEIRDGKLDLVDEKIEELREINRRKKRSWSPLGILRGGFKGGKRIVGSTLKAAGGTLVTTIKDPRKLVLSTLTVVATGGASSIKDVGFKILKTNVTRAGRRAMYAETAKLASKNKGFKKLVELKNFLGIKTNPDVDAALEGVNDKDEEEEDDNDELASGDESDSDDSELGYDGEGGYDDDSDDADANLSDENLYGEAPTFEQILNAAFSITYTLDDYQQVRKTDDEHTLDLLDEILAINNSKLGKVVNDTGAFTFSDAGNGVLNFHGSDGLAKELEFAFFAKSGTYNNGVILESGTSTLTHDEGVSYCHYSIDIQFYIEGDNIIMSGSITNNYPFTTHETTETIVFDGISPLPVLEEETAP